MSSQLDSNSFQLAIAEMEMGSLLPRLSEDLNALVKAVRAEGRKGKLTLELEIKPSGANGQVKITSDVKVKAPQPEKGESIFFSTEHGQLMRQDPRQRELPFGKKDEDADAPRKASNS